MPRTALKTPFRDGTVGDLAERVLEIARQGLRDRARLDSGGTDEVGFLDILDDIQKSRCAPAENLLDRYTNVWGGNVDSVFMEEAY